MSSKTSESHVPNLASLINYVKVINTLFGLFLALSHAMQIKNNNTNSCSSNTNSCSSNDHLLKTKYKFTDAKWTLHPSLPLLCADFTTFLYILPTSIYYSASTLTCPFIINSSGWIWNMQGAEFLACMVSKTQSHMNLHVEPGANVLAAGRTRMRKMQKVWASFMYGIICFRTSHNSVTQNFKYGKLLHVRKWYKQVPWRLDVKRPSYSSFLHANLSTVWTI